MLAPKAWVPFKVLRAKVETVTIRQDGLGNTISIDRVVKSPTLTPERAEEDMSKNETKEVDAFPNANLKRNWYALVDSNRRNNERSLIC